MTRIKKIGLVLLGFFTITSVYGAKKVSDLINISSQLKYRLQGFPYNINFNKKTIQVKIVIKNPTEFYLNASNFVIKNIMLKFPSGTVIAKTETDIKNIEIPPNSEVIIEDVIVKIILPLTIPNIIQLTRDLKDINKIKVFADIEAYGHKIITVNT